MGRFFVVSHRRRQTIDVEKWFGTFPRNLVIWGLRYSLGLGRVCDLQDSKRSLFSFIDLGRCASCLEFRYGIVDSNCGTATCPEGNVALATGSVGMVPKATIVEGGFIPRVWLS
ncbi:unnamed protein product [Prunus armeniaca]